MKCLILQHQTMESHVPQDIIVGIDVGEPRSPVVSGHPRASPAEGLFHSLAADCTGVGAVRSVKQT